MTRHSTLGDWSLKWVWVGKGVGKGCGFHYVDMGQVTGSDLGMGFVSPSGEIFSDIGFYYMKSLVLVGSGSSAQKLGPWGVKFSINS